MKKLILLVLLITFITVSCYIEEDYSETEHEPGDRPPQSNILTVRFKAVVDYFEDTENKTNGSIKIGSEISGYYKIIKNPTIVEKPQKDQAIYWDAIEPGEFLIKVGDYEFKPEADKYIQYRVADNYIDTNLCYDLLWLSSNFIEKSGPSLSYNVASYLYLQGDTLTINTTDMIFKPNPSAWYYKRVGIDIKTNDDYIQFVSGIIKSMVFE